MCVWYLKKKPFYFVINTHRQSQKNSLERSVVPFTQLPLMVNILHNYMQYQNQKIDIGTVSRPLLEIFSNPFVNHSMFLYYNF